MSTNKYARVRWLRRHSRRLANGGASELADEHLSLTRPWNCPAASAWLNPQLISHSGDEFVADGRPSRGDRPKTMLATRLGRSTPGAELQRFAHQLGGELSRRLALPLRDFLGCRQNVLVNVESGPHVHLLGALAHTLAHLAPRTKHQPWQAAWSRRQLRRPCLAITEAAKRQRAYPCSSAAGQRKWPACGRIETSCRRPRGRTGR